MNLYLDNLKSLHAPMAIGRGLRGLGAIRNLALGKSASQSSTWPNFPFTTASAAVDGNRNGDQAAKSITITENQKQPWWQVDLGKIFDIDHIEIYNRTDLEPNSGFNYGTERLKDFFVFVSNDPFISNDPAILSQSPGVFGYFNAGKIGPMTSIPVGRPGRFVRIQLTGTDYLQLAEVEVYGDDLPSQPTPDSSSSTTPTSPTTPTLPTITLPAPLASLPLIGPVAQSGTNFLNQSFSLFGFAVPYYVPLAGGLAYYFFRRKRRR